MRITGGSLCGRIIKCPDGIIRPAMDRMRESLFSILGDLSGKSFLDLFAGSGVLSLEAASRGAEHIVLVEKDKIKINTIFENVSISPVKIQCHFMPVELFIMRNKEQFDYIFLDPPFPYKYHQDLILKCSRTNALKDDVFDLVNDAIESVRTSDSKVYLMSPAGKVFNQGMAQDLSKVKHLILICGHYEGIDERITNFIDGEISIGDYILTGGETASMVITDAVTRLIDGVITKKSLDDESFNDNLLDYPTYTRPYEYKGLKVPDVLISGHHENINKWRYEERVKRTKDKRPDLLDK